MEKIIAPVSGDIAPLVKLGWLHHLARLYRQCDLVNDRPSVVFAYTIKGWGLPIAGDLLNTRRC